jgi:hypothetical protein
MAKKEVNTPGVDPEKEHSTDGQAKTETNDQGIKSPEKTEAVAEQREALAEEANTGETAKPEVKDEFAERYKGKTLEELVAELKKKEEYILGRNDEIGKLRKDLDGIAAVREQIKEIEEAALKPDLQGTGDPEPEPPEWNQQKFIRDPEYLMTYNKAQAEYQKKYAEWTRKNTMMMMQPLIKSTTERIREDTYNMLDEKYKDYPVKVDRSEVQDFLNKNPIYFRKYGRDAYEKAYTEHLVKKVPNLTLQKEQIREEIRKEVEAEFNNRKQAGNIGMGDLASPSGGVSSSGYDEARMEHDSEYRDAVLADIEKKRKERGYF